jgi:hypothetical protein
MRVGWIFEALVSAAILAFGIVAVLLPVDGDALLLRADGLASIGLGLFGGLIAIIPFRLGERWGWWALWFYPVFWTVHLVGGLPPGRDPSTKSCSSRSHWPDCCCPSGRTSAPKVRQADTVIFGRDALGLLFAVDRHAISEFGSHGQQ